MGVGDWRARGARGSSPACSAGTARAGAVRATHPPALQLAPCAEVNFEELARSTEDFNGAQLKAVCVEAGMNALRRDARQITHEDYVEGIAQVQAKKKSTLQYYA